MNRPTPATCDIGDHRLAYFDEGHGEVVLLVHGITTYSFIWQNIAALLQDNYRVIGVDLIGCGASTKQLDQPFSIKNHAHILKQFMDKLGVEKLHFVGHDVGGGIGQVFAVDYPEMLYDLSLMNSVAYDFWPVQPIIAMRTPIIRQLAMAALDLGAMRIIIKYGIYHKDRLTPELIDEFWAPMKEKQGRKAFLHFAASLDNHHLMEIRDALHKLDLPILILRGEADVYLSGSIADKLAQNLSACKLVKISTGGHFIQLDEPELISLELENFFANK